MDDYLRLKKLELFYQRIDTLVSKLWTYSDYLKQPEKDAFCKIIVEIREFQDLIEES